MGLSETLTTMTRQQRRAWKRKMDAAAKRFDTYGCAGCGAPWAQIEIVISTAAGDFEICCAACAKVSGRAVVALGASSNDAVTHGSLDCDWFAAHPSSDWRLRDPLPGEIATLAEKERLLFAATTGEDVPLVAPDISDPQILAMELEPGRRVRLVVARDTAVTSDMVASIKRLACSQDIATQQWASTVAPLAAVDRVLADGRAVGLMAVAKAQGEARGATKHGRP